MYQAPVPLTEAQQLQVENLLKNPEQVRDITGSAELRNLHALLAAPLGGTIPAPSLDKLLQNSVVDPRGTVEFHVRHSTPVPAAAGGGFMPHFEQHKESELDTQTRAKAAQMLKADPDGIKQSAVERFLQESGLTRLYSPEQLKDKGLHQWVTERMSTDYIEVEAKILARKTIEGQSPSSGPKLQ